LAHVVRNVGYMSLALAIFFNTLSRRGCSDSGSRPLPAPQRHGNIPSAGAV